MLSFLTMLFLLRPRQTWMPYALPVGRTQQEEYNRQLRNAYESTHRVAPYTPAADERPHRDPLARVEELAGLHDSGVLTDAEFAAAKARVLATGDASS
jgi:hypothetical protein